MFINSVNVNLPFTATCSKTYYSNLRFGVVAYGQEDWFKDKRP